MAHSDGREARLPMPRLAEVVFRRALELADQNADIAVSTIELSGVAEGSEDVLDRARAHAAAMLHADPKNAGALGAVVLLATAARQLRSPT